MYHGEVSAVGGEVVCCCHVCVCWSSEACCSLEIEVDEVASADLLRCRCGTSWRGLSGGDVAGVTSFDDDGVDCIDGNDGLMKIGLGGYLYIYPAPLYRW